MTKAQPPQNDPLRLFLFLTRVGLMQEQISRPTKSRTRRYFSADLHRQVTGIGRPLKVLVGLGHFVYQETRGRARRHCLVVGLPPSQTPRDASKLISPFGTILLVVASLNGLSSPVARRRLEGRASTHFTNVAWVISPEPGEPPRPLTSLILRPPKKRCLAPQLLPLSGLTPVDDWKLPAVPCSTLSFYAASSLPHRTSRLLR